MKVIGTVGALGSGKDEVLKYLKSQYNMPYLSTGDMVRKLASEQGLETTRENLDAISRRYFAEQGKGCFVRLAGQEIIKLGWSSAGISGVRSPDDVAVLKEMFRDDFILVSIEVTDMRTRYLRVCMRREERDPSNFNHFQEQDSREEEIFGLSRTLEMADHRLNNDGSLNVLHQGIEKMVADFNLFTNLETQL